MAVNTQYLGAGRLKHRVTFAMRTLIDDGYGNAVSGPWENQFTVPASVLARLGGEQVLAARLSGQQPYQVIVRQNAQTKLIRVDWKAKDENSGNELAILSIIDPDDRHAYFEILCMFGVAA